MDITSSLIGLALLLLFIGPIFYLILTQNKKERATKKLLNQKIEQFGIKPDQIELTPTLILGLDTIQKKLLIVNPISEQADLISLSEISKSRVKIVDIPEIPGQLNIISLELLYKDKKVNHLEIIFYEEDDANPYGDIQLQVANKWEKIINGSLVS